MRFLKACGGIVLTAFLAACGGGGGDAGTSEFGDGDTTTSTTADMIVALSKSNVANTGSDSIIITATTCVGTAVERLAAQRVPAGQSGIVDRQ